MQFLLLQEIDASKGVVVYPVWLYRGPNNQHRGNISTCVILLMHVLVLINLLNCLIFTIFELAGTPFRTGCWRH